MIGSRKELVDRAVEEIDETIELHRPYVDDIHLTCPDCGKTMTRVTDVIDCLKTKNYLKNNSQLILSAKESIKHEDGFILCW